MIKLGVGLYRHMLTADYLQFARQAGCEEIVIHLVDYHHNATGLTRDNQPIGADGIWGEAGHSDAYWQVDALIALRERIEAHGLKLAAIENFDPAHWSDILLDGPRRAQQIAHLQQLVRNVGAAGIPCIGYNFSLAGVTGRYEAPRARGGAITVGMDAPFDTPMPPGTVWNMTLPRQPDASTAVPIATPDQLWDRLTRFLNELCPVAEASGVKLAAHPDDPPMPTVRQQPRLVHQPAHYQRLLDAEPSRANMLELCVGTLGEMTEPDLYERIEDYARAGRIAYVHLRNVTGRVPHYTETFIDDGDIDMLRIFDILARHDFDGVIIPDHTPRMTCPSPWHAGMAHTLGFMAAAKAMVYRRRGTHHF